MSTLAAHETGADYTLLKYGRDFPFFCMYGAEHSNREAHMHHCTELSVILNGRALHFTNTGTQRLKAGDVLVMSGPRYHGFRATEHLHLMCLQFDPAVFLPADDAVRASTGFRRMFAVATPAARRCGFFGHMRLPKEELGLVSNLVWQLNHESRRPHADRLCMVRALFHQLVIVICRNYRARGRKIPHRKEVAEAIAFIEQHYHEDITIAQIVKASGLSHAQFHRLFRKEIGFHSNWYLRQVRVNHAAILLRDTDQSITEIGFAVGFNDSNYFTQAFKRALGATPRAYRKEHKPRAASERR